VLPRGYSDFGRQLAIWFGFYFAYLGARSFADRNPAQAFWNGWRVLSFEQRTTHDLVETTTQQFVNSSHVLLTAAAWTYWNSEFTVVGLALLWVYVRHNERFRRFRNTVLLANVLGLVGYVIWPTAPPWMFTTYFQDGVNHSNGVLGPRHRQPLPPRRRRRDRRRARLALGRPPGREGLSPHRKPAIVAP
jgi:hypothetical protein